MGVKNKLSVSRTCLVLKLTLLGERRRRFVESDELQHHRDYWYHPKQYIRLDGNLRRLFVVSRGEVGRFIPIGKFVVDAISPDVTVVFTRNQALTDSMHMLLIRESHHFVSGSIQVLSTAEIYS